MDIDLVSLKKYLNEAKQLKKEGRLDEAIVAYKKAIELDSSFPKLYQELAKTYSIKAQYSIQQNKF
jgi:tetratricopeptide (TPR) repeat protein